MIASVRWNVKVRFQADHGTSRADCAGDRSLRQSTPGTRYVDNLASQVRQSDLRGTFVFRVCHMEDAAGIAVVMNVCVRKRTMTVTRQVLLLVPIMIGLGCIGQPSSRTTQKPPVKKKRVAKSSPTRPSKPKIDMSGLPGQVHIVQAGDTLYSLAERYYGHNKHFRRIFSANRKRLADPNRLPVGMRLIIPPASEP